MRESRIVDPGVGGPAWGASAHGAAGVGVGGAAGAEDPGAGSRRLEELKPLIDALLRTDLDAPRKQRHTARRVLARLVDEHAAATCRIRRCVTTSPNAARRSPRGRPAAGEGFVPQTHEPGAEAEVDFADLWVDPARGDDEDVPVHVAAVVLGQGGAPGVRHPGPGGVPGRPRRTRSTCSAASRSSKIRYDNLKSAVSRVLFGRDRTESARWVAFRSHYGFDAFYCQPGVEGAHEKGGVEGEGGRFRRNHLVPVPKVDTMAELNELLVAADARR